jgi:hypothetical protein
MSGSFAAMAFFFNGGKLSGFLKDEQNPISFVLEEYSYFLSLWTICEHQNDNASNFPT